jgi:hypothetical protein
MVTGRVRFLLSMFAREPVQVIAVGPIGPGTLSARWNGSPVETARERAGVRVRVPEPLVDPGVNELELELPPGSALQRLDFVSTKQWWR